MKSFGEAISQHTRNIILEGFDPVAAAGFTQVPLAERPPAVQERAARALLNWTQETLADDMGVSKRSVISFIKELSVSGHVTVKRQGLGRVNVYTLHAKINRKTR